MWKDVSSYSRSDKVRRPDIFELSISGGVKVVLVWNHFDYPNEWLFSFRPFFTECGLGLKEYDQIKVAKSMALGRAVRLLEVALVNLKEATTE